MTSAGELTTQRQITSYFIGCNPISVELIPTVRTRTASGGSKASEGTRRVAQTFRLIDQSTASGNVPGKLSAQDGQTQRATHQLLGLWDAVMAVGDHWAGADGTRYEIIELLPDNGYERRAKVIHYG